MEKESRLESLGLTSSFGLPPLRAQERLAAGEKETFLAPEARLETNLQESSAEGINAVSDHTVLPFEIVLDPGAAEHVLDQSDAPGYTLEAGAGSA